MEIKEFKDDLFDAVWRHGKNLFMPMLVLNVISSAVLLGILIPVFLAFFPLDVIAKFTVFLQPQNMSDQQELILFLQEFMMDNLSQMVTFIFIAMVLSILVSSWVSRVGYSVSRGRLEGESNWWGQIGKSFDRTLVQTIKGVLVIIGLYLVVLFAAFGITAVYDRSSSNSATLRCYDICDRLFGANDLNTSGHYHWQYGCPRKS
jgi:hypothetical protein